MLYSTTDNTSTSAEKGDPNAYLPFKVIDAAIIDRVANELNTLGERDAEGRGDLMLSFGGATYDKPQHLSHSSVL